MENEIRKQINKIKNLNESINVHEYEVAFNLISKYINFLNNENIQINEYVSNKHISMTFQDVSRLLELEHMYPDEFHSKGYNVLNKIKEYFSDEINIENTNKVYQQLSRKEDYLRQLLKLIYTRLPDYVNNHINKRNLNSDKIHIKN